MVAEFRGVRLTRARLGFGGKDKDQKNLLPYIGWAEVFLVTLMLALHGKGMGNGEAAFAAALPILTRLAWMMVISDLKDPSELTEEMKLTIAERQQKAKEMLEEAKATAGEHAAKMEKLRREEEADRIELRRASQAKLERKRAEIEEKKMEQQGNFELKQAEMEGKNNLEELEAHLKTRLQIQKLQSQQEVQLMRLDAENNYAMQAPIFSRSIVGEVVRPSARRAISSGDDLMDEDDEFPSLEGQGLSQTELKQARWALGYYTINARRADGVTKSAFCKANNLHAPRLSEATANFPPEWFMERGLATWTSAQN